MVRHLTLIFNIGLIGIMIDSDSYCAGKLVYIIASKHPISNISLGPEHQPDAQGHSQPSYCTLPMFHPPQARDRVPPGGGYVSDDGHHFGCRNPVVLQQAFHV
jgi:hypothetical protein